MAYTIPGAKVYMNAVQTSFNGVVTACSILTLYLFVSSHIAIALFEGASQRSAADTASKILPAEGHTHAKR